MQEPKTNIDYDALGSKLASIRPAPRPAGRAPSVEDIRAALTRVAQVDEGPPDLESLDFADAWLRDNPDASPDDLVPMHADRVIRDQLSGGLDLGEYAREKMSQIPPEVRRMIDEAIHGDRPPQLGDPEAMSSKQMRFVADGGRIGKLYVDELTGDPFVHQPDGQILPIEPMMAITHFGPEVAEAVGVEPNPLAGTRDVEPPRYDRPERQDPLNPSWNPPYHQRGSKDNSNRFMRVARGIPGMLGPDEPTGRWYGLESDLASSDDSNYAMELAIRIQQMPAELEQRGKLLTELLNLIRRNGWPGHAYSDLMNAASMMVDTGPGSRMELVASTRTGSCECDDRWTTDGKPCPACSCGAETCKCTCKAEKCECPHCSGSRSHEAMVRDLTARFSGYQGSDPNVDAALAVEHALPSGSQIRRAHHLREAKLGFDPFAGPPVLDEPMATRVQDAFGPSTGVFEAYSPSELGSDYGEHMTGSEEFDVPPGGGLADYLATQIEVEEIALEQDGIFDEEKDRALADIVGRIREAFGIDMIKDEGGHWKAVPIREASSNPRFTRLAAPNFFQRLESGQPIGDAIGQEFGLGRFAEDDDYTVQCAWCNAIKRGDEWTPHDEKIQDHATHTICQECRKKHFSHLPTREDPTERSAARDHTSTEVDEIPPCDLCQKAPAAYDGRTDLRGPDRPGPWANMCEDCFAEHGVGLGLGMGQRLVLRPQAEDGGDVPRLESSSNPRFTRIAQPLPGPGDADSGGYRIFGIDDGMLVLERGDRLELFTPAEGPGEGTVSVGDRHYRFDRELTPEEAAQISGPGPSHDGPPLEDWAGSVDDRALDLRRRQQLGTADPHEVGRFESEHPELDEYPRNLELALMGRHQDRMNREPWASSNPGSTRTSKEGDDMQDLNRMAALASQADRSGDPAAADSIDAMMNREAQAARQAPGLWHGHDYEYLTNDPSHQVTGFGPTFGTGGFGMGFGFGQITDPNQAREQREYAKHLRQQDPNLGLWARMKRVLSPTGFIRDELRKGIGGAPASYAAGIQPGSREEKEMMGRMTPEQQMAYFNSDPARLQRAVGLIQQQGGMRPTASTRQAQAVTRTDPETGYSVTGPDPDSPEMQKLRRITDLINHTTPGYVAHPGSRPNPPADRGDLYRTMLQRARDIGGQGPGGRGTDRFLHPCPKCGEEFFFSGLVPDGGLNCRKCGNVLIPDRSPARTGRHTGIENPFPVGSPQNPSPEQLHRNVEQFLDRPRVPEGRLGGSADADMTREAQAGVVRNLLKGLQHGAGEGAGDLASRMMNRYVKTVQPGGQAAARGILDTAKDLRFQQYLQDYAARKFPHIDNPNLRLLAAKRDMMRMYPDMFASQGIPIGTQELGVMQDVQRATRGDFMRQVPVQNVTPARGGIQLPRAAKPIATTPVVPPTPPPTPKPATEEWRSPFQDLLEGA